jgi:ribosomal protein L6P/L9E
LKKKKNAPLFKTLCSLTNYLIFTNGRVMIKRKFLNEILYKLNALFNSEDKNYLAILTYNGVGFRIVNLSSRKLRFDLGKSHILECDFNISNIFLNSIGNKVYIFSKDKKKVFNALTYFLKLKKYDFYRGKGLFEYKKKPLLKQSKKL